MPLERSWGRSGALAGQAVAERDTYMFLTVRSSNCLRQTNHTLQLPNSDSPTTLPRSSLILTQLSVFLHKNIRSLFRDLSSVLFHLIVELDSPLD